MKYIALIMCLQISSIFGSVQIGQNEHIPGTSLDIPKGDNLRVMSYNVRIDNEKDRRTENDWPIRRSRVEWMIDHYDPDVIGIQEPCKNQLDDLMDELSSYSVVFVEETPDAYLHPDKYPTEFYLETNAIMYKKDRIELVGPVGKFWLAEDSTQPPSEPAWDGSDRSRVVIYAKFRDKQTNNLFYAFSTHFEIVGKVVRVESAKLVMETAKKIAGTTPAIIMGDFNTFSDENGIAAYEALASYQDDYANVYDVAEHEFGMRGTWLGFRYSRYTEKDLDKIYPGVPARYDHIFVNKNVKVVNTGVADDYFSFEWNGEMIKVASSDHRPIIADVILHKPVPLIYEMPAEDAKSENSIRLFSYNIRVDHEQDQETENKWELRADKAIFLLQKYLGEIIALQEPNVKQVQDIKAALGPDYTWIYGKASDRAYENHESFKGEQHRETQAIGFDHNRFNLLDSGRFWLAENPDVEPIIPAWDGSAYSRVVVYALLEERNTGKKFGVFTAHFDHAGVEARINSAKLIVKKAVELSKGSPFIISGDLNTFQLNGGPLVYEAFEQQFDIITDVRDATLNQYGPVSTWVGWYYNLFNEKIQEQMLPGVPSRWDHIFISKTGVLVERTAVCDDQFEIEWNGEAKIVYPSDHRPLFMDFTL